MTVSELLNHLAKVRPNAEVAIRSFDPVCNETNTFPIEGAVVEGKDEEQGMVFIWLN